MPENNPSEERVCNTINDFIETARKSNMVKKNNIICPACGSEIGTVNQGSFHYMLTDQTRGHLNNKIDALRQFLEGIEHTLKRRNYTYQFPSESKTPYGREVQEYLSSLLPDSKISLSVQGEYNGMRSAIEAKMFSESFDPYDWINNYDNFPLIDEKTTDEIKAKIYDILILGSEPPGFNMVMNVVFQQEDVEKFRRRLGLSASASSSGASSISGSPQSELSPEELSPEEFNKNNDAIKNILKEVCPFYSKYLDKYEASKGGNSQITDAIRRLRFVLAILLGHKYSKLQDIEALVEKAIIADKPYHLPERTYISVGLLSKLINDRALFDGSGIEFSDEFLQNLRSSLPEEDDLDRDRETIWFEEIHKVINFTCAHVPTGKSEPCGWYPKQGETHPIVLLGSQGTGKSSLMMTGLTALYNSIGSIGCVARPEGFLARQALEELDGKYLKGVIEPPTRRGAKNRIELSIAPVEKPFNEVHFVFLDIAGEDVASIVTGDAPSQDLKRLLSNAKTIVFLFDFTAEPSIREILPEDDKYSLWKAVRENYSRTEEERIKTNKNTKISLDQFNLLTELVHLLRKEVGETRLKKTKFICVIPKADLFVHSKMEEEENKEYFLTSFFKDLQAKHILVSSPHAPAEGFKGMYSLAGVFKEKDQQIPKGAYDICRYISDKAKDALVKIGDTLPSDTFDSNFQESRDELARKIRERLIQYTEECFGKENCYFIPVSAIGEDTKDLEPTVKGVSSGKQSASAQGKRLGHRPNQKLSEYVFLLPIVLAQQQSTVAT